MTEPNDEFNRRKPSFSVVWQAPTQTDRDRYQRRFTVTLKTEHGLYSVDGTADFYDPDALIKMTRKQMESASSAVQAAKQKLAAFVLQGEVPNADAT